jgi:ABC-type multidrug transport system permease subunit
MIGLRNTAGAFTFFVLQMFASLVAIESVMSALAVLTPNYTIGMIVGAGYLGLFILTCGYFALPDQLPDPVWRYPMYYLSVYTYLFQGFLLNEFQVRAIIK